MARRVSRRAFLASAAATSAMLVAKPALAQGPPRVVVVGGGFAGTTVARAVKRADPRIAVTLAITQDKYVACPFSNLVIAGLREMSSQQFGYRRIVDEGIEVLIVPATGVEPQARQVRFAGGPPLTYDRLVLAPGIYLRGLPGYSTSEERMPHAWQAGEQTLLLRRQLEAMEEGGTVLMSVPDNPYRCPPGPYERASLIAHYLKTRKPRSKLIVLDAKDQFSKQRLFQAAWKELYPDHLEWVGLSQGGKVVSVDAAEMTLVTEFGKHKGAVVNVIPPQRAAGFTEVAEVADSTGWCPVDPVTFESRLVPNIHVVGDATIAGGMPKSAFAANAQAKVCAAAIVRLLNGEPPSEPRLINTCYSLVAPDYGVSVAGVYRPVNGVLTEVPGSGGVSPLNAPRSFRAQEALYAASWFNTVTSEVFG
jgi:NADPH-dependent 2,4-dienoyl-CoA reductase/sulfur reductase-like enzyme